MLRKSFVKRKLLIFQGNIVCAGYILGQNMTDHAINGIYDGAANTVWARGSSAAVIWTTGSKHKG